MTKNERDLPSARAAFADSLIATCGSRSEALRRAFATVPREEFLASPPWRLLSENGEETSSDPAALYRDVLVAIDLDRMLFNGSPRLWTTVFDLLEIARGEHVVHVGAGTGYYTAILAEIVGGAGSVLGLEVDPGLAERAAQNLRGWPQVVTTRADGAQHPSKTADVIVVNAGATHVVDPWLDGLRPGGRLYVPLTVDLDDRPGTLGVGAGLLIRREPEGLAATFAGPVMIFHCFGARTNAASASLGDAFQRRSDAMGAVRSIRRDAHEQDSTCWCHLESRCISATMPRRQRRTPAR